MSAAQSPRSPSFTETRGLPAPGIGPGRNLAPARRLHRRGTSFASSAVVDPSHDGSIARPSAGGCCGEHARPMTARNVWPKPCGMWPHFLPAQALLNTHMYRISLLSFTCHACCSTRSVLRLRQVTHTYTYIHTMPTDIRLAAAAAALRIKLRLAGTRRVQRLPSGSEARSRQSAPRDPSARRRFLARPCEVALCSTLHMLRSRRSEVTLASGARRAVCSQTGR